MSISISVRLTGRCGGLCELPSSTLWLWDYRCCVWSLTINLPNRPDWINWNGGGATREISRLLGELFQGCFFLTISGCVGSTTQSLKHPSNARLPKCISARQWELFHIASMPSTRPSTLRDRPFPHDLLSCICSHLENVFRRYARRSIDPRPPRLQ